MAAEGMGLRVSPERTQELECGQVQVVSHANGLHTLVSEWL